MCHLHQKMSPIRALCHPRSVKVQTVLIHPAGHLLCRCVHDWMPGTVGMINCNKIKASLNNAMFPQFFWRLVKSDLNIPRLPYCFSCNDVSVIAVRISPRMGSEALIHSSISYLQLPRVSLPTPSSALSFWSILFNTSKHLFSPFIKEERGGWLEDSK